MICTTCDGKGIVPASAKYRPQPWNGVEERRTQERRITNDDLRFREVEAALYQSCPQCEGSGKLHPNLLSTAK
jgi:DnaJ-class molecular chaperone